MTDKRPLIDRLNGHAEILDSDNIAGGDLMREAALFISEAQRRIANFEDALGRIVELSRGNPILPSDTKVVNKMGAVADDALAKVHQMGVSFTRKEGGDWEEWGSDLTPKPPRPEDAPFFPADKGMAQWPSTGVHFHAIRFGDRVWDAVNGWRDKVHVTGNAFDDLIRWLDERGVATTTCTWGNAPGETFRSLIQKFQRERSEAVHATFPAPRCTNCNGRGWVNEPHPDGQGVTTKNCPKCRAVHERGNV